MRHGESFILELVSDPSKFGRKTELRRENEALENQPRKTERSLWVARPQTASETEGGANPS